MGRTVPQCPDCFPPLEASEPPKASLSRGGVQVNYSSGISFLFLKYVMFYIWVTLNRLNTSDLGTCMYIRTNSYLYMYRYMHAGKKSEKEAMHLKNSEVYMGGFGWQKFKGKML